MSYFDRHFLRQIYIVNTSTYRNFGSDSKTNPLAKMQSLEEVIYNKVYNKDRLV